MFILCLCCMQGTVIRVVAVVVTIFFSLEFSLKLFYNDYIWLKAPLLYDHVNPTFLLPVIVPNPYPTNVEYRVSS
jgi:hypothetical protein